MKEKPQKYADSNPPPWIDRLLQKICDPALLEGILGDLHEIYEERLHEGGYRKANWLYAFDAMGFLRPFSWKKRRNLYLSNYPAMYRNYFKIAVRNLYKYKTHSAINILGLTIGLAGCILIGIFIMDELKYDDFHPDGENIYRVYNKRTDNEGSSWVAIVPPTFAPTMVKDFPEVESGCRIMNIYSKMLFAVGDKQYLENNGVYAEANIFDFFGLELLEGDPATALTEVNSVLLTESMARKYFEDGDALGKTIQLGKWDCKVTGIMKDPPRHFHLDLNYIISFATVEAQISPERMTNWVWQQFFTYIKLQPGTEPASLIAKFPAFVEKYAYPHTKERGFTYLPYLQNVKDIHLNSSELTWDIARRGNANYIYSLGAVGLFLLLIACINFINLSTARAERHSKEVGMRKVAGAKRSQIITQFLGEAVLFSMISVVMAAITSSLLLPSLNELSGKIISLEALLSPQMIILYILVGLIIGILAGMYPAFFISRFRLVRILDGSGSGQGKKSNWLRQSLVVVQFTLSIMLMAGTFVIFQQVNYLNNKQLGFSKSHVLSFPMKGKIDEEPESAKAEFLRHPGVLSATAAYGLPGDLVAGDDVIVPGKDHSNPASLFTVDHDYISTMEMEIIAGRDFSREFPTDADEAFIINETAVRELGFGSPEAAIGQELYWNMWNHNQELKKGRVVGVVRDFHFKSLHEKVATAVLHIYPSAYWKMALKIRGDNLGETMAHIQKVWDNYETGYPLDYQFIDESFGEMYEAEERLSTVIAIFTLLTILVACIGLLGLVAYSADRRTREIGIRKVLGASTENIVGLLATDFVKLVFISFIIATPIAWILLEDWLKSFPYKTEINLWTFVLVGLASMLIALFTISFQSLRAAKRNPVHSLRYE